MVLKLSIPVVINRCYGGYGLSDAAKLELLRRKGWTHHFVEGGFLCVGDTGYRAVEDEIARNDPDLIDVVRTMGAKADGPCAKLEIVSVEVEIEIESFDGKEQIRVGGHAKPILPGRIIPTGRVSRT
jgi:hypothetical protein